MAIQDDVTITFGEAFRIIDYVGGFGADGIPTNTYSSGEVNSYVQQVVARPEQSDNVPLPTRWGSRFRVPPAR